MFKARGQPGCWYGYAEIDGVTYKIDARHVGKGVAKHFEGTIKRHLKADQQTLEFAAPSRVHIPKPARVCALEVDKPWTSRGELRDTGFDDDELPEEL